MKKREIVEKVKALNLPKGSYVVYGSAPLAVAGLREARDIDMLVTRELFEQLRQSGWQQVDKGKDDKPIAHDIFEAHYAWMFGEYHPTLEQLLATATVVDGVPFASLQEVRKWKAASKAPKHQADVELIDQHFAML